MRAHLLSEIGDKFPGYMRNIAIFFINGRHTRHGIRRIYFSHLQSSLPVQPADGLRDQGNAKTVSFILSSGRLVKKAGKPTAIKDSSCPYTHWKPSGLNGVRTMGILLVILNQNDIILQCIIPKMYYYFMMEELLG